jgi:hypothetical protein
MNETKVTELKERRKELLTELTRCRLMVRGTAFERYSTCSRPTCKCHAGDRHGPRHYVAVSRDGRQRQHYVPVSQRDVLREGVGQFHKVMSIIDEITTINLRLMKKRRLGEPNGKESDNV